MHGGKRKGAGRKVGSRTAVQQAAIDIAAAVLNEIDAKQHWLALLRCGDNKVIADVMKYLTDRAHGKARQPVSGDSDAPILHKLILVDAGSQDPEN